MMAQPRQVIRSDRLERGDIIRVQVPELLLPQGHMLPIDPKAFDEQLDLPGHPVVLLEINQDCCVIVMVSNNKKYPRELANTNGSGLQ